MHATRVVKDLVIGERSPLDGFDEPQRVRKAKPIRTGVDAGLSELTRVAPDGETERIALAPEAAGTVVGQEQAATDQRGGPKAKAKPKSQVKRRTKPAVGAPVTPQTAVPPVPQLQPKTVPPPRGPKQAPAKKPLSCLDAAAKVLTESGQPMSCPELIAALAAKGYWTSPAGKTPAATLYAALVREIVTKQDQARFRKTGPGRFAHA
jgi:hypothetical protein